MKRSARLAVIITGIAATSSQPATAQGARTFPAVNLPSVARAQDFLNSVPGTYLSSLANYYRKTPEQLKTLV